MDPDDLTRQPAAGAADEPTAWFDRLYAAAARGEATVPWDLGLPNPLLVDWADRELVVGRAARAVVVGAGYGRDAELVARLGYETIGFDISPTAMEETRRRYPDSPVEYVTADLFDLPPEWLGAFALVLESMTVQSLPEPLRRQATHVIPGLVAPGGRLLVVAAGRRPEQVVDGPPWPLTMAEIEAFADGGLDPVLVEEIRAPDDPTFSRWRAEFRRPDGPATPVGQGT